MPSLGKQGENGPVTGEVFFWKDKKTRQQEENHYEAHYSYIFKNGEDPVKHQEKDYSLTRNPMFCFKKMGPRTHKKKKKTLETTLQILTGTPQGMALRTGWRPWRRSFRRNGRPSAAITEKILRREFLWGLHQVLFFPGLSMFFLWFSMVFQRFFLGFSFVLRQGFGVSRVFFFLIWE